MDNKQCVIKNKSISRDIYKIIFTNKDNKDIEYEIIATIKSKAKKKIYYLLTDNTRDNDNKLRITVYYINYDENKELSDINDVFYPVIDNNELESVFAIFNKIQRNL